MDFHLKQCRNQHESEQHSTKMPKFLPEHEPNQQPQSSTSALPLFVPEHNSKSGYWGRAAMDPEPGRCRRTDGKKWRCSRDIAAGNKYCERHMHHGRNDSGKPVELPKPTSATSGDGGTLGFIRTTSIFSPSFGKSPFDLLHLNERSSGTKNDSKSLFETEDHKDGDGHVPRHFFDDWPGSVQKHDHGESNAGQINSATRLSISTPAGNTSSDVSLKLSSGYGEDPCQRNGYVNLKQLQLDWGGGWTSTSQVASMGGPLAEALRSVTSTSSPKSVLLQLSRSSGSETSFISA